VHEETKKKSKRLQISNVFSKIGRGLEKGLGHR
jgi:hypothetical protein